MSEPKNTNAENIIKFCKSLKPDFPLPPDVEIMNPYADKSAMKFVKEFYQKFYNDSNERVLLFGINPGRFGGGITGVPFTDPVRLEEDCKIENPFQKKEELSAQFIYQMIQGYGGPEKFYRKFFITAISPLGFTKNGINLNYYDDKALMQDTKPFILSCIKKQLNIFKSAPVCFCLGEGTNYKYFSKLNAEYKLFEKIVPLPHPRWIMQYRRKKTVDFIDLYLGKLKATN